ncbi:P-loop containing nucleoside triphosphate hydrolase protein [Mycena leptocephala]|nr:P-loop containing nucleoside triphosphate hydrolase protein [Mycena leptocephala]
MLNPHCVLSSTSLSLLPSQPKIFHGRDSELQQIVNTLLSHESARIAILGAGGIGKTSLAKAVLHHPDVATKYECRLFIGSEHVTTSIELAALIAAHLGLKPGNDLTKPILSHLSKGPHCLLVLDNLETSWEPMNSRSNIEHFISLVADIPHLILIITMRGAERPAKVHLTRPFLTPLKPLTYEAARQTFIDIADDFHNKKDVDQLLRFTDNLPLAVDLVAHLVDYEGCPAVLARWKTEKTSMLSSGYDRVSSLDASISLPLASPRITSLPSSKDLLSLLSILPDGLSEIILVQSNLPIKHILTCKTALLRTSLAYIDDKGKLKLLVPIREHVHSLCSPSWTLVQPLQKYFSIVLEFQAQPKCSV